MEAFPATVPLKALKRATVSSRERFKKPNIGSGHVGYSHAVLMYIGCLV
jgi:hypothetical protein